MTRTDPDPRVRHRADALLLLAPGHTAEQAAQDLGCCTKRIRVWRRRFMAEGRGGLADRPRAGRPPALDGPATALLATALAASPLEHGDPVTIWTVADLTDLLAQRGWSVSRATVFRRWQRLGYRDRRPRHDLTHRQGAEAVVSAKYVSAAMRTWGAAQEGRMLPCWLPAYTPNLNLLERVWRFLTQRLACPRFWADRDALGRIAGALLNQTNAHFHAPDRLAIRVAHNLC